MSFESLRYDFVSPRKIVFGCGRRRELGAVVAALGRRAFLVSGSRTLEATGALDELRETIRQAGVEVEDAAAIAHEPEVADVDRLSEALRAHGARPGDVVVGVGGGSAIDLAKAGAALATQAPGSVLDYLEGVGSGRQLDAQPLPFVAVPTTGGTGSEATKNAVISSYDPPFKKSLRAESMLPAAVVVDAELMASVPPRTTAYTGMDAITQLIESVISRRAAPIPTAVALHALELAAAPRGTEPPAIVTAVEDGSCLRARERMAHAALSSGWALANSGLGMAHGVAAALGAHCRVPHGLACAVMLPVACRENRSVAVEPLARIGSVLTGRSWPSREAAADAAVEAIAALCAAVGIPRRLGEIGVPRERIPEVVSSSRGNSMSGNPRDIDDAELTRILEAIA